MTKLYVLVYYEKLQLRYQVYLTYKLAYLLSANFLKSP